MIYSDSDLGCSVHILHDMSYKMFSPQRFEQGWKQYDVYTPEGLDILKKDMKADGSGICIWADTSETKGNYSGKRFYEYLKSRGEHVTKSRSYKNPNHDGVCTLYTWYFRRKPNVVRRLPKRRPVPDSRRKAVVKKDKTTTTKLAAKQRRAA